MTHSSLTQKQLQTLLNYDAETGVFTNKITRNPRAKVGEPAGALTSEGYTAFQIDGKKIYAHRAAWLYVHGVWPTHKIDHINQNRNDNRLCNLREADDFLNAANAKKSLKNTSGHKGVTLHHRSKKWQVQMRARNKTFYVGQYCSLADAIQARAIAEILLYKAA